MPPPPPDPPAGDLSAALAAAGAALGDPALPLDAALRRLCELSAAALGVERVGVWQVAEAGRVMRCLAGFERTRAEFSQGTTLRTADFPRYFAALAASASIPAAQACSDARTSELADAYLKPLGISSLLDTPVTRGPDLLGVLCHEHVGPPRDWTAAERSYAESLGPLLAGRLGGGAAAPGERAFVDQLAAGVAHDFKNLLTVILGYADIVGRRATLSDPDRDALRRIAEAADRGNALADDLMLIASSRPRRTQVICPTRKLEAALPLLRSLAGPRHEVVFDAAPQAGRVFLDPSGLERVVSNLVVNARDAMPDGGPITLRISDADSPFEGQAARMYKCIEVADRGTGIDPAVRERLFEPFVSTKSPDKGTGLGLAIVKQIVERAGGLVQVNSVVGEGTTFRVYLPRISADAPAEA